MRPEVLSEQLFISTQAKLADRFTQSIALLSYSSAETLFVEEVGSAKHNSNDVTATASKP